MGHKIWYKKKDVEKFGAKRTWGKKTDRVKKILGEKTFLVKKNFGSKNNWGQKNLGKKNFGSKTIWEQTVIRVNKNSGKNLGSKKLGVKNIWGYKNLGQRVDAGSNWRRGSDAIPFDEGTTSKHLVQLNLYM